MDNKSNKSKKLLHPVLLMLIVLFLCLVLSYLIPSGTFSYSGKNVIPNSYTAINNTHFSLANLFIVHSKQTSSGLGILDIFLAIPDGFKNYSTLIMMVLIIGGMFGVLQETGLIEKGIDRLLVLTKANLYLLTFALMIILSLGSTFVGLISEYLIIIPIIVALMARFGLSNLVGLAVVAISAKLGYIASVTNPFALSVAQPIAGIPVLSGIPFRFCTYILLLVAGCAYMFFYIKKLAVTPVAINHDKTQKLDKTSSSLLVLIVIAIVFLIYAQHHWAWNTNQLSTFYIIFSLLISIVARLNPSAAAEAFISGMRRMVLAAVLIGMAGAVDILLKKSMILDTIIYELSHLLQFGDGVVSTNIMMFIQMILDVLIPSTSGQAAVTLPILVPVGHQLHVSAQSTVSAFLFGNGLSNIVTPTSGMLLAYLATARVNYLSWLRFILPLFVIFLVILCIMLSLSSLF
ncbi:YfcC family protein [Francisella sp. SYW-9]|uniref:YfcC family protein n=1 Tax=Francisella sp. SYW-9 TaxID=2610888 RepID=UPI00123DD3C7|nr:YfcC family protein [Francisella sp. SYW-9]